MRYWSTDAFISAFFKSHNPLSDQNFERSERARAFTSCCTSLSLHFPKVILETASAGVPSVLYGDYGASEWITTRVNGWVVDTKEDIIALLDSLENEITQLKSVSNNALKLAEEFDWSVKIKDWEEAIDSIKNK